MAFWTNASVLALAGDRDPEAVVTAQAEDLALEALSDGWEGPPYDPFDLARRMNIPVVARDELYDARIVPGPGDRFTLEYNPSRPRGRVRFSVAHELAHTLFPDAGDQIRHRSSRRERVDDDWQLEMLCNIAASELLMPTGAFPQLTNETLDIQHLMDLRRQYDVSTEALMLRVAKIADQPVTMFASSRPTGGNEFEGPLRIDYSRVGHAGGIDLRRGLRIPSESVAYDCTAVGYTAKGTEMWFGGVDVRVDAVGVPPYPGHPMPRVVGILRPTRKQGSSRGRHVEYVTGDATRPRGHGRRVIVHVVNDRTPNWGGGFARALRDRYPEAQATFREWSRSDSSHLRLGAIHIVTVGPELDVATLVAQKGYGPSSKPRIRYEALRAALRSLAEHLRDEAASVHMPRIGAGMARGNWDVVAELIRDELVDRGHGVTVYSLPGDKWQPPRSSSTQQTLNI